MARPGRCGFFVWRQPSREHHSLQYIHIQYFFGKFFVFFPALLYDFIKVS